MANDKTYVISSSLEKFLNPLVAFSFSSKKIDFVNNVYNLILEILGNDYKEKIFFDQSSYFKDEVDTDSLDLKFYEKVYGTALLCVVFISKDYRLSEHTDREYSTIRYDSIKEGEFENFLIIECDDLEGRIFDDERDVIRSFENKDLDSDIAIRIVNKLIKNGFIEKPNHFIPKLSKDYLYELSQFGNRHLKSNKYFEYFLLSKTKKSFVSATSLNNIIFIEGPMLSGKTNFVEKYYKFLKLEDDTKPLFLEKLVSNIKDFISTTSIGENFVSINEVFSEAELRKIIYRQIFLTACDSFSNEYPEKINYLNSIRNKELATSLSPQNYLKETLLELNKIYESLEPSQDRKIVIPIDDVYYIEYFKNIYTSIITDFHKVNNEIVDYNDNNTIPFINSGFKIILLSNYFSCNINGIETESTNLVKTYYLDETRALKAFSFIENDYVGFDEFKDKVSAKTGLHPWYYSRFIKLYLEKRIKGNISSPNILFNEIFDSFYEFIDEEFKSRMKLTTSSLKQEFGESFKKYCNMLSNGDLITNFSHASNPIIWLVGIISHNIEYEDILNHGYEPYPSIEFISENIQEFKKIIKV